MSTHNLEIKDGPKYVCINDLINQSYILDNFADRIFDNVTWTWGDCYMSLVPASWLRAVVLENVEDYDEIEMQVLLDLLSYLEAENILINFPSN